MARTRCIYTNKHSFPSELEANLALANIHRNNTHHRRRKYRDEPVRSYLCEGCGGWHLTSMTLEEYESDRTVSH